MSSRAERLHIRNLKKDKRLQSLTLKCPSNVEPIYLKNSLVSEPDDTVRAFVVMRFPYIYPDKSKRIVEQAFYRTSGHNSQAQFGDKVTDSIARGTWIPSNGLVGRPGYRDSGVCVMTNLYSFILKEPFTNLADSSLLSRFHSDPQLAFISYLMGGGIWRVPEISKELGEIMKYVGLNDYTQQYTQGCINLTNKVIPISYIDINNYIGNAVSWNWHPIDIEFLQKSGLNKIDLRDPILWVEKYGKVFIPEQLLVNPNIIKGYINSGLRKMNKPDKILFTEEKLKDMAYQSATNQFTPCP